MYAPQPHQVKRPRLSLSCVVCRSRKVRCGREQPECNNCIRFSRKCVYKAVVRDASTGRARHLSPTPQDTHFTGVNNYNSEASIRVSNVVPSQANVSSFPVAKLREMHMSATVVEPDSLSSPSCLRPGVGNMGFSSTGPSHAQPWQHQVPVAPAYVTGYSREELMEVPSDHEIPKSGISALPDAFSDNQTPQSNRDISPRDHLSVRRGARVRYIGKAFWGFVAGQESLSDDFFDENRHAHPNLPLPHIGAAGLANALRSLPSKLVCDILIEAFFVAVWPIIPLVHIPTFQVDYDEFWEWCRNIDTKSPPSKLLDDPSFISLLFAVLLCGASGAPASMWASRNLQATRKETTMHGLKSAYTKSLLMNQHLEHPTFNSLVSTLLTGPFIDHPYESMQSVVSVSTTVRIAQTMGLHSERTWSALNLEIQETRRRVWLHIVWLDVQSSIASGLPVCCGSDMHGGVSMIAETPTNNSVSCSQAAQPFTSGEPVATIYAIGRFETAHLESLIVASLQSAKGLTYEDFSGLFMATKQLHQKIDTLIAKLRTEDAETSSRLNSVCQFTHPKLSKEELSQNTVLVAWTRVMLMLLKFEVAILLQKPLLQEPECENPQARKTWISIAQLCLSYLRTFLQVHRDPAFAPYMWFYRTSFGPLQSTFLLLTYLLHFREAPDYQTVRSCVDDIFDDFIPQYRSSQLSPANSAPDSSVSPMPVAIQVLFDLHRRLDSPSRINTAQSLQRESEEGAPTISVTGFATKNNNHGPQFDHSDSVTSSSIMLPRDSNGKAQPDSMFHASLNLASSQQSLTTATQLEAWSSILVKQLEDFSNHRVDRNT